MEKINYLKFFRGNEVRIRNLKSEIVNDGIFFLFRFYKFEIFDFFIFNHGKQKKNSKKVFLWSHVIYMHDPVVPKKLKRIKK